jgi:enoyl-CoA hydratase/carnithine racemase
MAEFETILLDVADGIATITLNRPDKLNAFTPQMMEEMIAAFDVTDASDEVRAVIVTGAGRAFCAGADLSGGKSRFAPVDAQVETHRDGGGILNLRIYESLKPVIAAINGPSIGVGMTMTLPMDIRLASENARFAVPFVRRGILPDGCSSWFLPRVVGPQQALEWLYTGRTFEADEALSGGLVRSIHPAGELLQVARALATEMISASAPVSNTLTRQLVWRMLAAPGPMDAHLAESRGLARSATSPDAIEGITSFLEKRPPVFPRQVSTDLPDVFVS